MFGKSAAVIDARRDVKRRVVEVMVQCAEIAPIAVTGNGILNEQQVVQVANVVGHGFLRTLTPAEIDTLKTAKGCSSPPPGIEDRACTKLYQHISKPQLGVQAAGCMAAFVHDGVLWAKQVAIMNPHSQINWPANQARIDAAVRQLKVTDKQYFMNPGLRMPQTADQAIYWLVYQSAQVENTPNPAASLLAKFNTLHADFKNNPNISLLANNYQRASALFVTWYVDMKFPAEFL